MKQTVEATVLVEGHPCLVMEALHRLNARARVEAVKLREGVTDHVVAFEGDDKVLGEVRKASLKVMRVSDNKVWIRTSGCAVCRILYHNDVIVERAKVVGERKVMYTLLFPGLKSMKSFLGELNNVGVKATVLSVDEVKEEELTDRQMEILKLAYKMGYFDVDRKVSLKDLAEKLNVSVPTLEEIMRRALKKAVKYYLEKKG